MSLLCDAIRRRAVLEFDYHGHHRIVAPYCHGESRDGVELLRAVQLGGSSASGGLGFGKLWRVSELVSPRLSGAHFEPDDPQYNPRDRAMQTIHCRV